MALPNYVKFQRGSLTAYNRLAVKDDNTLYFIFNANDETRGSLYLGDKLISSNVGGSGATSLNDLTDVLVSNANTGDFLVKDSSGIWKAIDASAVAQLIIDSGNLTATIDIDENEFHFNAVNGKLELNNYADATIGMVPVKGDIGLSWQTLPPNLSTKVESLEEAMSTVQTQLTAVDGKIASAIANSNHLSYQVVENLPDNLTTNTIYLKPKSTTSANDLYEEFMVVDGSLEKLGNFGIDLSGYATTSSVLALDTKVSNLENELNNYVTSTTFNAVVGDLTTLNSEYSDSTTATNVVEYINDIYHRLTWIEMSEE